MPNAALSTVVARAGRAAHRLTRPDADDTDGRLLARFVQARDEAAFAELVRRLGPMVLGVCRRVSGDAHLADDAFQAAFVVLARRAADVRPREAVRGWLYGVAVRTAREARAVSARRRTRELPVPTIPERPAPVRSTPDPDALAALDEEVAALPDHLRVAVVLCELDGVSRKDAAARLGVPEGTLSSRLAKARKLLAARLKGRGVALAAALTAVGSASAAVPPRLAHSATAVAMAGDPVPSAIAALSNGVFRAMYLQKLKLAAVGGALVALALLAGGILLAADPPTAAVQPAPKVEDPKLLPKGPNKILFWRKDELVLIDPDGKNEMKVGEGPGIQARLSPDGKKIAFLIRAEEVTPPGRYPRLKLHVRELDEKGPGTDTGAECQSFAWSPYGTEIACSAYVGGNPDTGPPTVEHFLLNVTTKEKTPLKLPDNRTITDWSRDGKHFLTASVGRTGPVYRAVAQIHLMNRDGTGNKALTDEKGYSTWGLLSPDGKRVLFTQREDNKEEPLKYRLKLKVLDIATGKVAPVEELPIKGEFLPPSYCWSPDGERVAYVWREVHEGKPEDVRDKETRSFLVVCDLDGRFKTIATEKGAGPWRVTIWIHDWR